MTRITHPDHPELSRLCDELSASAEQLDAQDAWPAEQLDACARRGVFEWFLPTDCGGQGWSDLDVTRGYLELSRACLTTTFVITQRTGACMRIAAAEATWPREQLLGDLLTGRSFATVAISHLTTSRRHLAQPVLRAERTPHGFRLEGYSAWVTGADRAAHVVTGATLADGQQILIVVPTDAPGVTTPTPERLVALTASRTGRFMLDRVELDERWLLAGPDPQVMRSGRGAGTGGLQTSTLAVGLAAAALDDLERQAVPRRDLEPPATALRAEWHALRTDLFRAAAGDANCSNEELRRRANSLVLRATQAALAAAKGTGYVVGHPAGRWCREALFFLVWSCPQPVVAANLCELAGLEDGS